MTLEMSQVVNRQWLPLDVVECILEQLELVDEDLDDRSSLKACSTVCRDFAPLCQKRIFSNVALSDDVSNQSDIGPLYRLESLLRKKPHISDYIRTLKYKHSVDSEMPVAFIFDRLRFVTTFHLGFRSNRRNQITPSWSTTSSSFQNALLAFLSSNDIVWLTLDHIDDLPGTMFGRMPGLLLLTTDWVTLNTNEPEEYPQLTPPKLRSLLTERGGKSFIKGLRLPQPRSWINFSLLEDIKIRLDYVEPGMELITGIIGQSHRLKSIYLEGSPPYLDMRDTFSSCLHAESLKTLKSIKLDIELDNEEQDPYCYLSDELADISTTTSIEEIELSICIVFDTRCTTELEDWSSLDEVLLEEGAFPALRRVKIEVTVCHFSSDPEELESQLLFIRDNAFPLLSTSDQVEFVITVETCLI